MVRIMEIIKSSHPQTQNKIDYVNCIVVQLESAAKKRHLVLCVPSSLQLLFWKGMSISWATSIFAVPLWMSYIHYDDSKNLLAAPSLW